MSNDLQSLYANTDSQAYTSSGSSVSLTSVGTIVAYIRWDAFAGGKQAFKVQQNGGSYYLSMKMRNDSATVFLFQYREDDLTARDIYVSHSLSAATWYMFVFQFHSSDNTFKTYAGIKGAAYPAGYTLILSQARNGTSTRYLAWKTSGVQAEVAIGSGGGGEYHDGHICHVLTYSDVQSNANIDALNADWASETSVTNRLHYWKLNEDSGTSTATDFQSAQSLTYTDGALGAVGAAECPFTAAAAGSNPPLRRRTRVLTRCA